MNFDRIARFYGPMETGFALGFLKRCREAFLHEIPTPHDVLMIGEGQGRFLSVFCKRFPCAAITVLDGSERMLEISKTKLANTSGIGFVHSMIEDWKTEKRYDLIITNFMLDCVPEDQLEGVIEKIASLAKPNADWLVAEFHEPEKGPVKWCSRIIVGLLYAFFRKTTGIESDRLCPHEVFFTKAGFACARQRTSCGGLLKSEWWSKR